METQSLKRKTLEARFNSLRDVHTVMASPITASNTGSQGKPEDANSSTEAPARRNSQEGGGGADGDPAVRDSSEPTVPSGSTDPPSGSSTLQNGTGNELNGTILSSSPQTEPIALVQSPGEINASDPIGVRGTSPTPKASFSADQDGIGGGGRPRSPRSRQMSLRNPPMRGVRRQSTYYDANGTQWHQQRSLPRPPQHATFCDGCNNDADIIGTRWLCLSCTKYDLCDRCYQSGGHEHKMLKIEHPDDYEKVEPITMDDESDCVLLGLRVYTKDFAPVKIAGQLRHSRLLSWVRTETAA
ncbi:hypothetical protein BD410DRAFT_447037 [Rickenella mellea]|uniref:ZZ-type domain-containing protein n=1 Tax=Rickenella mellea TaxID=50990 RepID=A0A4Y7PVU8_9AGAM|nr:hypothetical protein BD410DRAFT_447037 [Rickenella mellea]